MIAAVLCTLQLCHKESFHDVKGEQYWREQNEKLSAGLNITYEKKLSVLQVRNDSLIKQLNFTKSKLSASKLKQHVSELKVLTLAEKKDSSNNVVEELRDYDSLKVEAVNYVHEADSTQAYCDSAMTQMQNIISVKDTALKICETGYEKLKEISEDNLRREQRLTDELDKAVRTNKRKIVLNKFLTGGFLILSGVAAAVLLNAKK